MPDDAPSVTEVLAAAVEALGGQERPGQIEMAEASRTLRKVSQNDGKSYP